MIHSKLSMWCPLRTFSYFIECLSDSTFLLNGTDKTKI